MNNDDIFKKKEQRCTERIERRKEEADWKLKTESEKADLDLELLQTYLDNEEVRLEEKEEERDIYYNAHKDKIQKHFTSDERIKRKNVIVLWAVLGIDLVVGLISMGAILEESLFAMLGSAVLAAGLLYMAGIRNAAVEKDPDTTKGEKSTAAILQLGVFSLVISIAVLQTVSSPSGEGTAYNFFFFILMVVFNSTAYMLTKAVYLELYVTKANAAYQVINELCLESDKKRLELEAKKIERKINLEETLLKIKLDLHETIEQMEDKIDNVFFGNIHQAESAIIAKQQQQIAEAKQAHQQSMVQQAQEAKQRAEDTAKAKRMERRNRRFGRNTASIFIPFIFGLFALGSCQSNPPTSTHTIFIDPSSGAVNVQDVLNSCDEAIAFVGNNMEQPNRQYGQINVHILREQTGIEHHEVAIPTLPISAALEQKKTKKVLQEFCQQWEELKEKIHFKEEGYEQSRVAKSLFESIRHTRQQPYHNKQISLYTDLLEHTSEISFLRMTPQEIRSKQNDIIAFLEHYCQCESLEGVHIRLAYKSKNEPQYDQHRVEIESIYTKFLTHKGATVSIF